MAAKNPKAGRGPCPSCGASIAFRRSLQSGKLTFTCDECDCAGYADQGGAADRKWSATLTALEAPAPATKVAKTDLPATVAPAAQAVKPGAKKGFSLADV
jgi:hypothetical protein